MKDNETNTKTNTLLLTVIGIATLMVAVIGATFAYFTANQTSSESASTILLSAGELTVTYGDGTDSISATLLEPKATALGTKTFTVTGDNNTDATMYYKLQLVVTTNTFVGQNYNGTEIAPTDGTHEDFIKYSLTGAKDTSTGTVAPDVTKQTITTGAQTIDMGTGSFGTVTGGVHTYTFSLFFEENNKNQDIDKNKTFEAHIQIATSNAAISTTGA